jgi:hypothetical protein
MIDTEVYSIKDGNGTRLFAKRVDTSKPKMWVEGLFYRFNSSLTLLEIVRPTKEK